MKKIARVYRNGVLYGHITKHDDAYMFTERGCAPSVWAIGLDICVEIIKRNPFYANAEVRLYKSVKLK